MDAKPFVLNRVRYMADIEQMEHGTVQGGNRALPLNNLYLPILVGSLALLLCWLHGGGLIRDGDTFWHLRVGQWIIENQTVPLVDYFSHTFKGEHWVAHEWLSELILYITYSWDGWRGVVLVTALAVAFCFIYLSIWLQAYLQPRHVIILLLLVLAMVQPHLMVRPHVLAQPLLLVWAASLIRLFDARQGPNYWLLLVMLVWANMHGSFLMGLLLLLALLAECVFEQRDFLCKNKLTRQWVLFVALAFAISLVTPQGVGSYVYVVNLMAEDQLLKFIGEWKSPNFHSVQPLEAWIVLIMGLGLLTSYRLPLFRFFIIIGLMHLSLKHIRNVEVLGILTPCLLASSLSTFLYYEKKEPTVIPVFGQKELAGSMLFIAVVGMAFFNAFGLSRYQPADKVSIQPALNFIEKEHLTGNVLNTYVLGGPLIMAGIEPYIDGRGDMYGSEFMADYLNTLKLKDGEGLALAVEKFDIKWTLLLVGTPLNVLLEKSPQWQKVYSDERVVIHIKESSTEN